MVAQQGLYIPGLALSISKMVLFFLSFFSPSSSSSFCYCPWCPERLSGGALKYSIPNEMWLVLPCCSISSWWIGHSGKEAKKKKKARPLFDELHRLSKSMEEAVQFSPSQSRKEDHTFLLRHRTIVDNYLVESPGRWHLQHTVSGRHTTHIWLSKCNGAIVLMLAMEVLPPLGEKKAILKNNVGRHMQMSGSHKCFQVMENSLFFRSCRSARSEVSVLRFSKV